MKAIILVGVQTARLFLVKGASGVIATPEDIIPQREIVVPVLGKFGRDSASSRVWLIGESAQQAGAFGVTVQFDDDGIQSEDQGDEEGAPVLRRGAVEGQSDQDNELQALLVGAILEIANRLSELAVFARIEETVFVFDTRVCRPRDPYVERVPLLNDVIRPRQSDEKSSSIPPYWLAYALRQAKWPGQYRMFCLTRDVFERVDAEIYHIIHKSRDPENAKDPEPEMNLSRPLLEAASNGRILAVQAALPYSVNISGEDSTRIRNEVFKAGALAPLFAAVDVKRSSDCSHKVRVFAAIADYGEDGAGGQRALSVSVQASDASTAAEVWPATVLERPGQDATVAEIYGSEGGGLFAQNWVTVRLRLDLWGRLWASIVDESGDLCALRPLDPRMTSSTKGLSDSEVLLRSVFFEDLLDLWYTLDEDPITYLNKISFNGRAVNLESEHQSQKQQREFPDLILSTYEKIRDDLNSFDQLEDLIAMVNTDPSSNEFKKIKALDAIRPRTDSEFDAFFRSLEKHITNQTSR